MFRSSFVFRFVAMIVFLGLLAGAGFMAYRAGEARGYALGVTTTQQSLQSGTPQIGQGQVNPAVPVAPYGYPGYFYGYRPHFFFPFGLLFFPFALLFFFFVIGGLFRFMLWGVFGRAAFGHGQWRHAHGPWGHHHGPWGQPGAQQPQGQAPTGEQPPAAPAGK